MVAGERQAGHDRLRLSRGRNPVFGQLVADDLVVHLGVERAVEDGDAGAARAALLYRVAEARNHFCLAVAVAVLQGDEEASGRGRVVAVIAAAPCIDVDHAVRRHDHMTRMSDIVGEHAGAEALRQHDPACIAFAPGWLSTRILGKRDMGREGQHGEGECRQGQSGAMRVSARSSHDEPPLMIGVQEGATSAPLASA